MRTGFHHSRLFRATIWLALTSTAILIPHPASDVAPSPCGNHVPRSGKLSRVRSIPSPDRFFRSRNVGLSAAVSRTEYPRRQSAASERVPTDLAHFAPRTSLSTSGKTVRHLRC